MSNQERIQNEVNATLDLLENMYSVKAPIDFEKGVLAAWEADKKAENSWAWSMILRAAVIAGFIALNSYVLIQKESDQVESRHTQTIIDEYGWQWETLSYE